MGPKEIYWFMVSSRILPLILKNNTNVTAAVTKDGSMAEYEQATCNKHAVNDGLRSRNNVNNMLKTRRGEFKLLISGIFQQNISRWSTKCLGYENCQVQNMTKDSTLRRSTHPRWGSQCVNCTAVWVSIMPWLVSSGERFPATAEVSDAVNTGFAAGNECAYSFNWPSCITRQTVKRRTHFRGYLQSGFWQQMAHCVSKLL